MPLTPSFRNGRRSGQTMIFLIILVVIMVFVVLWNFDLHKTLSVKTLSQNAGDSAAMAAARWQAVTLNVIGDLNIMHAVALTELLSRRGDPAVPDAITELQARLCYAGPMIAMLASQQAAKQNGMHNNDDFTSYITAHVNKIRNNYPKFISEAYPGCLGEYADMLEVISRNGVAAGPDSMMLYSDYVGDHMLLNHDFYDAVGTRAWCWFFHNAYDLLRTYVDRNDWEELPSISNPNPINSEFFGLHLTKSSTRLDSDAARMMNELKDDRELSDEWISPAAVRDVTATWYGYGSIWYSEFAMADSEFPAAGAVKPQYNYAGTDAAIRTKTTPDMRTPGGKTHTITWTAAAKPFGYLNEVDKPTAHSIVLPAFHDVRLIPVDASSSPLGGSFDLDFRAHVENHLQPYISLGTLVSSCWYCQQIQTWDDPVFRQQGIDWLATNSSQCVVSTTGGSSGSGGSRRGH